METDRITVTVTVGQVRLPVVINREWEHYFREAEKAINDSFLEFAKKWTYKGQEDLMAKVLLDITVKWLADAQRLAEYDEECVPMMESLKALADKFETD